MGKRKRVMADDDGHLMPLPGEKFRPQNKARAVTYSPSVAAEVFVRMASGETVTSICKDAHMPCKETIAYWIRTNKDGFGEKYREAIRDRALWWAEEILDIADDSSGDWIRDKVTGIERLNQEHVQRSRLRVDARKWLLVKLIPEFRDKTEHQVGPSGVPGQEQPKVLIEFVSAEDKT